MNIVPFITPLTPYDTTGAAKALASNRDVYLTHEDRQASLAENKRQFNEELPLKQFSTYGNQYNENRRAEYVQNESDTKLLQWIKQITEDDPEKAQAAAPFIHGLLKLHGIDMNFDGLDDSTGQPTQAAPAEAPAEAAPVEEAPPQKAPPAAKPYETKLSPSTKAATRKAAPDALPPGLQFGQYLKENFTSDPGAEQDVTGVPWQDQALRQREVPQPQSPGRVGNDPSVEAQMLGTPASVVQAPPGQPEGNMRSGATAPQAQSAGAVAPPAEVQAEMAQQGQPYTGQTAPEPPPPRPRGQWTFTKNGKELMSIDTGKLRELNERRTGVLSQGAEASVLPPEDKAYVAAMMDGARKAGMNPEELQVFQKNWVQPELDRRSRERGSIAMAHAKSASASTGSQERLGYDAGAEHARKYLADQGMPEVTKALAELPKIREKLSSGNYNATISAAYGFAKLNDPKGIVTDKDYANALGKTLWDKVKDFVYGNDPTEPNLNPEEISRLAGMADVMEKVFLERRAAIIAGAMARTKRMPNREMVNGALDTYDGAFAGAPEWDSEKSAPKELPSAGGKGGGTRTSESSKHGNLSDTQKRLMEKQ